LSSWATGDFSRRIRLHGVSYSKRNLFNLCATYPSTGVGIEVTSGSNRILLFLAYFAYFLKNKRRLIRSPSSLSIHPPNFVGLLRSPCCLHVPLSLLGNRLSRSLYPSPQMFHFLCSLHCMTGKQGISSSHFFKIALTQYLPLRLSS
jgi:hypothetical protein